MQQQVQNITRAEHSINTHIGRKGNSKNQEKVQEQQ
jgi:hypothetical protein